MGYLNKSTLVLDAILTNKGRDYLRKAVFGENQNGEHAIVKWALSDDEIDYGLWDETPSGSNYVKPYGRVIDNQPVTEPIVTNNEIMRYFLFKEGIDFTKKVESPPPIIAPFARFTMNVIKEIKEFNLFKDGNSFYEGKGK